MYCHESLLVLVLFKPAVSEELFVHFALVCHVVQVSNNPKTICTPQSQITFRNQSNDKEELATTHKKAKCSTKHCKTISGVSGRRDNPMTAGSRCGRPDEWSMVDPPHWLSISSVETPEVAR